MAGLLHAPGLLSLSSALQGGSDGCVPPAHGWSPVLLPPSRLPTPRSLHQVHDEEKGFELELAWICEESGRQFQRVPQQLAEEAEAAAKAALEAEDMDD